MQVVTRTAFTAYFLIQRTPFVIAEKLFIMPPPLCLERPFFREPLAVCEIVSEKLFIMPPLS